MVTTAEYNDRVARDMLEAVLQERVRHLALLHGWRYYHTHRSQHSPAGFPDVCAVRDDRLLFAELKRERGKTSPEQAAWLGDLETFASYLGDTGSSYRHVGVYLWRPSDLLSGAIDRILR